MTIYLDGHSAIEALNYFQLEAAKSAMASWNDFKMSKYNPQEIQGLGSALPYLSQPYEILVPHASRRQRHENVKASVLTTSLVNAGFFQVASDIFAPIPAFAFMRAATRCSTTETIRFGYFLLARFAYLHSNQQNSPDDETSNSTIFGIQNRIPLTTQDHIRLFLEDNIHAYGARKAQSLLPHIHANAASPPEISCCMKLSLPHRLGGLGLRKPLLNERFDCNTHLRSLARKQYYVADIYFPDYKAVVEYDSRGAHWSPEQVMEDSVKEGVLEAAGLQVVRISAAMLRSPAEMERVAQRILRFSNRYLRVRCSTYAEKRSQLYNTLLPN